MIKNNTLECITKSVEFKYIFQKYNVINFTNKNTINYVIIWNPIYCCEELFNYRKNNNLNVLSIERGPLPNTIYISKNINMIEDKIPNKDITEKENSIVLKYIDYIKKRDIVLQEQQKHNIDIIKIKIKNYKQVIFIPLQVYTDISIKRYSRWIKNISNLIIVINIIATKYNDILFIVKNHPVENKKFSSKLDNIIIGDKYHFMDILDLSDKVITINSSVGLYSMIFNKPCGILGDSFYIVDGVNLQLNNVRNICTFIENINIKIDYNNVKKYIYNLKYRYLYDVPQKKNKETNNKTKFLCNDVIIHF
jgi:hypothetical protein